MPFCSTALKTVSSLERAIAQSSDDSQTYSIDILLHKNAEDPTEVVTRLMQRNGVDPNSLLIHHGKIRAEVPAVS